MRDLICVWGDVDLDVVERAARCTKCKGKSISSVPAICIERCFDAMHSSHTPKDHKDWCRQKGASLLRYLEKRVPEMEKIPLSYIKSMAYGVKWYPRRAVVLQ